MPGMKEFIADVLLHHNTAMVSIKKTFCLIQLRSPYQLQAWERICEISLTGLNGKANLFIYLKI